MPSARAGDCVAGPADPFGAQLAHAPEHLERETGHEVERLMGPHEEIPAQRCFLAGAQADGIDGERPVLQGGGGFERMRHGIDDLGRHHHAQRVALSLQRADAEQRAEGAGVVHVAVREEERARAGEGARREAGVEHQVELRHVERRVDATHRHTAHGEGAQGQFGDHAGPAPGRLTSWVAASRR